MVVDYCQRPMVTCSIIACRLDYFNTLLHGALKATFNELQHNQNNWARVVCQWRVRANANPLLRSLHCITV